MTVRRFRNPEVPGPHARSVRVGDVTIEPGETKEVDLPRLQMYSHRSSDGSGGDPLGEVDQRCADCLEEVDPPAGLVFELGEAAPAEEIAPVPEVTEPRSGALVLEAAPVPESAED